MGNLERSVRKFGAISAACVCVYHSSVSECVYIYIPQLQFLLCECVRMYRCIEHANGEVRNTSLNRAHHISHITVTTVLPTN